MSRPSGAQWRAFLRGDLRITKDAAQSWFRRWRATIPYTDQQIADALETLAAAVESEDPFLAAIYRRHRQFAIQGRISAKMLGCVLPELIKRCALCEGRALYRIGNEGRCRKHKFVKDSHAEARKQRFMARGHSEDQRRAGVDDNTLRTLSLKALKTKHRK